MPGDAFKHVIPGQPLQIPAEAWNACIDAAIANRLRGHIGGEIGETSRDFTTVKIRNDSSADRDRWEVLGLDSPFITPTEDVDEFQNVPNFIGLSPTITHVGKFAILTEAITDGDIGDALIVGVIPTQLSVTADSDTFADVEAGQYKLKTGSTGLARILWKESGTGVKWGIVAIGSGGGASGAALVRISTSVKDGNGNQDAWTQKYNSTTRVFSDDVQVFFRNWNTAVAAFASGTGVLAVKVGAETSPARDVWAGPYNVCS